jgi:NADH:ubiquinone oxidoreductase subunit 5 (subunit L)/multisubunit Na+/H+ antiporter MnhA subunit
VLFCLKSSKIGKKTYYFLNRKWFFDKIYNEYIGQLFFRFAYSTSYKFIDKGIFEILGPTGFSSVILNISSSLNRLQTGYLYHYTSTLLIFLSLFLCLTEIWCFFEFFIDYRLFVTFTMLSFFIINNKYTI